MSLLKEDIKKMIDEYDKICRPLVVFINPEDAELLREAFPHIEDELMFRESFAVERGKCFAAKRKDLDNIMFGSISPSGGIEDE